MPRILTGVLLLLAVVLVSLPVAAQEKQQRTKGRDEEKVRPLPNDPELLNLHREFVKEAEKLAQKYEKDKQWSRAKDCYEEILKLVPQYPPAKQKVQELLQMEAQAQTETVVVKADEKWKDTGVSLIEGRPVSFRASGSWTFRLIAPVGANGLKIPDDLREFDPGCLVGMIVPPEGVTDPKEIKPFMIGAEKQMLAPKSGRLFVQIYDNDVRDNEGELNLEIRGTFNSAEFKPKKEKK